MSHDEKIHGRIGEIDFLRCAFILFMIAFHLVYFGDMYPSLKRFVYTFHMPAFLIISGYLCNRGKNVAVFFKSMAFIFVPYAIMECGYAVAAAFLPIREHIDSLTLRVLADKILFHPIGPYWYLHTLIVCSVCYYGVFHIGRLSLMSKIAILGVAFFMLSDWLHIMSFPNACYFLAGAALRQSGVSFLQFFRQSAISVVPLAFLCANTHNFNRATVAGAAIVYCVISLLLFIYKWLAYKNVSMRLPLYVGRNTMPLLLFSPIFTLLSKQFLPYLAFDPTGILFLITAVSVSVAGSFLIAYLLDKTGLSKIVHGKTLLSHPDNSF